MKDILSSLLSQDSAKQTEFEKILWFVMVLKWVQRPRTLDDKAAKRESVYTVRLKYLLSMLNKNPEWKNNFIETVSELMTRVSSANQFSKAGFSNQSFIQEFVMRLQEKILPKAPLTGDIENLIFEIFPNEEESLYIDFIDEDVLSELLQLFTEKTELFLKLKKDILSASYMLSVHLLNGLFSIRNELKFADRDVDQFKEFQLQRKLETLISTNQLEVEDGIFEIIKDIEIHIDSLEASMPKQGVKIELVYLFQTQKRKLRRVQTLLRFLSPSVSVARNLRYFTSQLILDTTHQKSLRSFISENFSLLTERIVQTNSYIGEHYVTYTWSEFRRMYASAAGGGVITAGTVFLKFLIGNLGFAGFVKGFIDSLNYASSFLLIHGLGMTLATKQPSATAPFIASALKKSTREARRSLVALLRTQFIAVLGNLSAVFPIAFLISFAMHYFWKPIMPVEKALEVFSSTNIVGPTIIYAVFTGFLLFFGSLMAGWVENWVIVNQVPKRIKYHDRLRLILGVKRCENLSVFISENSNAWAANIGLGVLLGFVPQISKFLSLGLDVRHVTLSTGSFAAALPSVLNSGIDPWTVANSVLGIVLIGFLNISVSFVLAFLLASTSSRVKFSSFVKLFRSSLRLLLSRPWLLFVPEKK